MLLVKKKMDVSTKQYYTITFFKKQKWKRLLCSKRLSKMKLCRSRPFVDGIEYLQTAESLLKLCSWETENCCDRRQYQHRVGGNWRGSSFIRLEASRWPTYSENVNSVHFNEAAWNEACLFKPKEIGCHSSVCLENLAGIFQYPDFLYLRILDSSLQS